MASPSPASEVLSGKLHSAVGGLEKHCSTTSPGIVRQSQDHELLWALDELVAPSSIDELCKLTDYSIREEWLSALTATVHNGKHANYSFRCRRQLLIGSSMAKNNVLDSQGGTENKHEQPWMSDEAVSNSFFTRRFSRKLHL
ncbi:hypothetical protein KP509_01G003100 [Ceratopteris richardii]|uniref:Uncharacterized protein n=1 Tax=Ceratopteris richardii TaxID=49495 RepID=A0A8T2VA45_CERRI|nr:hypothetical protein KP509_1Z261700 [Ceratopteris richardii]KAH7445337.1 hypothetical protein KP509_01G003100 [Ceratopteris richardii]